MRVEFYADVKRVYIRTAKNGATIGDLTLQFATTVIADRETGEFRKDTIDAFIYGDKANEWDGFVGKVKVEGSLRINRFKKGDVWHVRPEVAIKNIYQTKGDND